MADWWDYFWEDLVTAINAVFTDVNQIFHAVDIKRVNWANKIQEGEITPPWVVVQIPPIGAASGGPIDGVNHAIRPVIYYIAPNSSDDIAAMLITKGAALEAYLYQHPLRFTMTSKVATIDASDTNPANSVLLESNMPYLAVSVSFEAQIGFIPV